MLRDLHKVYTLGCNPSSHHHPAGDISSIFTIDISHLLNCCQSPSHFTSRRDWEVRDIKDWEAIVLLQMNDGCIRNVIMMCLVQQVVDEKISQGRTGWIEAG